MKNLFNDTTRGLVLAFFPDIFTALQLFGAVDWTGDQTAIAMSLAGKAITFFFYVVKTGQGEAPPPASLVIGEDPAQKAVRKASEND